MIDKNLLKEGINKFGFEVNEEQLSLFDAYAEALVEKNKVMNLTRVTEPEKIVTDHFLDSVSALIPFMPKDKSKLLDIGTGAGFPGVPLAIMLPNCKVFMMDSTGKKINFVKETCENLGIKNVEFIIGRAEEEAHKKGLRETFDCVYARAVSDMKILGEISLPFVKLGGKFIALKSINYKEELQKSINTIKNLGGEISAKKEIVIPGGVERSLILITKTNKTQMKYPRAYGVIVGGVK